MEYTVIYNGQSYDIPNYSIKISEKLEEIELLNRGNQKFREKCKKMYDFASDILGKETVVSILGKFDESDPNGINILYLEIVKSYNKPLVDYNMQGFEEKLGDGQIDKVLEMINAIPVIKEFAKEKK